MLSYELELLAKGVNYIAGVDEVGRGALAGPLVVCAAIINPSHMLEYAQVEESLYPYFEIKDSKLLSAKKRDKLSGFLQNVLIDYSLIEIPNTKIDSDGIMPSTLSAFSEAVAKLSPTPEHVLTDSFELPLLAKQSQTNLIRGDKLSLSIAAASIVAKVYRDNLMHNLHFSEQKYSVYGFEQHKGYGTAAHVAMIQKHGYSDIHRKSFKLKHTYS